MLARSIKFLGSQKGNVFLLLIFLLLIGPKIPQFVEMYNAQGTKGADGELQEIMGGTLSIPTGNRVVIVFWATWCGPCELELGRINNLIENKKISADSVIAISMGEAEEVVRNHLKDKNYLFKVTLDPYKKFADKYNVKATPTIVLMDSSGKIDWMTMGLSPTLELRLISFLGKS